jgi:hypothetical protein
MAIRIEAFIVTISDRERQPINLRRSSAFAARLQRDK